MLELVADLSLLYVCACYLLTRFRLFRPPQGSFGFGGGGGGTNTSSTVTELSPEQSEIIGLATPVARQFVQNPPTLFPGTQIAPQDPLQLQAQESALATGGTLQDAAQRAQTAQNFLLGPALFPESNPALAANIRGAIRPLEQQFSEVVLPGIRQGAITAGQFGGSRQGIAEGIAGRGLAQTSGDITAQLSSEAFQSGLDALTKALVFAPTTAQFQLLPAQIQEAVGAQRQQLAQQQLSEEAQRFIAEQLLPFSAAQDVAALAFGIGGGSSVTTSTLPGQQLNPFQAGLGIASLGAGALGGSPVAGLFDFFNSFG